MNNTTWKVLAIVFISLFIAETFLIGVAMFYGNKEADRTNSCFYDFCSNYPDAYYQDKICYCYDYDVLGDLIVVDTKVMD